MFEEYKELVVNHYRELVGLPDTSVYLKDPTPANLKRECLKVYGSGYRAETDKRILIDFFGDPDEDGHFDDAINAFKTPNFRPVQQFIENPNKDSHRRNIELLAWLTGYQPRPFKFDTFKTKGETPPPPKPPRPVQPPDIKRVLEKSSWKQWLKKYQKESALGLAVLGLTTVLLMKIIPRKQCMYWAGDHYEAVDCNKQIFGSVSIALDTMKLYHFKKITRPDTLTLYSIGKVWYSRIDGPIPECFTADGTHPLHPGKDLRPLTVTILRKYFGKAQQDSIPQR
ncbi:hypothetical protein ACTJKC_02305 [Pedobacter sp. 22226]|uniref:hypothetical protein n=1 Tax=Pedobacter sp. 22226 TaxID=3453894 RepID=UPI003F873954